jgi:hypothetical protein
LISPFDKLRAGSFDKLRAGSFGKLRAGSFGKLRARGFLRWLSLSKPYAGFANS